MTELEKQNEIRKRNGMIPLTELPKTPEQEAKDKEDAEKIEAKRIEKEAEDKKKADAEEVRLKEEEEARKKEAEIDDDKVLKYLQKKKGIKLTSFDDLKPKPSAQDLEKEKEDREADKISWGLKNGKFKKQDLENYFVESKDPKSLIFQSYEAKIKAANPEVTDEEVQNQFKERFSLDLDPESWQYKQGQEELALMSGQLINKKYGSIISLESEYSQHERSQNEKQSVQNRIIANAPAYKRDVEEVFSGISKYKTKIGDFEIEFEIPEDFIQRSKAYFLQDDTAADQITKGWKKEDINDVAYNSILIENRNFIDQKIGELYHLNKQKGTRGIIPTTNRQTQQEITDEKLKKAAERHGAVVPASN